MTDHTRVLYVDDDANSLEVRAMMLGEYGFDVVTETNVADARRRLAEAEIDCVLSDLDMPDEDGFDLLEYVRDTHPELPFIMFTSHESENVIEDALESGATDYFPKSMTNVSYRLLAHRIEQAIRTAEAEQGIAAGPGTPPTTESEDKEEVGVAQTEFDPPTDRSRTADSPGRDSAVPAEKTSATSMAYPTTPAPSSGEGTATVSATASNWKPATPEDPSAEERTWNVTSETENALAWLDSDEGRPREDERASEQNRTPDGEAVERDGFIYPAARAGSDRQEKQPVDDSESAEEELGSDDLGIVGTVDVGDEPEEPDVEAESTEVESEPDPEEALPISGIPPSESSAEPATPVDATEEDDTSNISRSVAVGAEGTGRGTDESGLGSKINLGVDAPEAVSEAQSTTVETESAVDDEESPLDEQPKPEVEPDVEPKPGASDHDHDHVHLDGFEPLPGEGVLVECGSQDDRKGHACLDLLGLDNVEGRNVLLIRYRQIGSDRLRRIAENAEDVHLISIGYRQTIPDALDDLVEMTRISNPSELTRLGIVMTRVIENWDAESLDTVICVDSLNVLMGYTDERSVFRFLHVLLSKLRSANAISHFHIEPSGGGTQSADTLKPLFDSVITIDDDGVHIE